MSKDIWHKADEAPKAERYFIEHYKVVVGDKVYWKYGLFKGVSNYDYPFDQDTARWCYLDDLLALETELERTRKALDVTTGFIKGISQTVINDCDNQYVVLGNFKKFAEDTLNQIKTALEQKDVK